MVTKNNPDKFMKELDIEKPNNKKKVSDTSYRPDNERKHNNKEKILKNVGYNAEIKKWEGVFERHPEIYQGKINDLKLIPKHLLPELVKRFDFVKRYVDKSTNLFLEDEEGNIKLSKESVKFQILEIVKMDEIDREEELKKLAKESKIKVTILRKQLLVEIKNYKTLNSKKENIEIKEEDKKYTKEQVEESIKFFKSKNILEKIQDEITIDHLGDDKLKMTLFLAEVSGLLKNPKLRVSCAIKGNSSTGKDNVVRSTLKHIPENKFLFVTNITQSVMEDDIENKNILALSEMNANKDDGANKHLIEAIKQRTEGGMASSKKDLRDGMKSVRHSKADQGTVIFSTTESEMDTEMKTRFICLDIASTPEKIRAVNENTIDGFSNIDRILDDNSEKISPIRVFLTGFSRVFDTFTVIIPYAKFLKEFSFIDDADERCMRDLKRVLALTCATTFLNFTHRKRYQKKGVNFVESMPKDIINTLKLSKDFFNQSYTGLDERLSKIVDFIKNHKNEWVERGEIQEKFKIKALNTLKSFLNELSMGGMGLIEGKNGSNLNNIISLNQYHSSKIYYKTCQKPVKKPLITCQLLELEEYLNNKTREEKKNLYIDLEKDTSYKDIPDDIDTFLLTPFTEEKEDKNKNLSKTCQKPVKNLSKNFKCLKDTLHPTNKDNKFKLKQGKIYSQDVLGEDSEKSMEMLELADKIEVIKDEEI